MLFLLANEMGTVLDSAAAVSLAPVTKQEVGYIEVISRAEAASGRPDTKLKQI
jgi:hypothetical protein